MSQLTASVSKLFQGTLGGQVELRLPSPGHRALQRAGRCSSRSVAEHRIAVAADRPRLNHPRSVLGHRSPGRQPVGRPSVTLVALLAKN